MSRDEALSLMKEYSRRCAVVSRLLTLEERSAGVPARIAHLAGMHGRVTRDFSDAKVMRWLGYMQGSLDAIGAFTLSELKERSRDKFVPHYGDSAVEESSD